MDKKKQKTKRLKIFDITRDGKGVSKTADMNPGFKRFFRSLWDNFGKLVTVNIIMVLGNFPFLFLIINLAGYFKAPYFIPYSDLFQNIAGLLVADSAYTPYEMTLFALEGLQNQSLAPTAITYVFYAISGIGLFTFGIVNVGTAYVLRNIASGDPVFVWHDFCYAVKRNYKQALPFGVIDALICTVLALNLYILISSTSDFLASMLFWSNVVLALLYFFMRYYMYVQMVTFKLSVFKMIKNSLIFALLGLKRNVCAFLGIVICVFLEFVFLIGTNGILIPVAVAAPLAILFSAFAYMKVYAAYFKIKAIMIDPYKTDDGDENKDEPLMRDDVTERERLEKIKAKMNVPKESV